jgi:ATP-binding cassette subfamily B protein
MDPLDSKDGARCKLAARGTSRGRFGVFVHEQASPGAGGAAPRPSAPPLRLSVRYWPWVRPHLRGLAVVFGLALMGLAADIAWPIASAYLIDRVILSPSLTPTEKGWRLAASAAGLSAVFCAKWALSWLQAVKTQLCASTLAAQLRRRLLHNVLRLPLSEIARLKTGGILARSSNDVADAAELLQTGISNPVIAGLRLIVLLAILGSIDARIGGVLGVIIPVALLWRVANFRQLRPIWQSLAEDRQALVTRVGEAMNGIAVVRAFRRERSEELQLAITEHTAIRKDLLAIRVARYLGATWDLIVPLMQVGLLCGGGYLIVRGELTLGLLAAIESLAFYVFDPIAHLGRSIDQVQHGFAAAERILEVLERPLDKPDVAGAVPAPTRIDRVEFDAVSFAYTPGCPIIHDVNLELKRGSVVALIGPSGAGKTTISQLLARFHDPTAGAIRINGIDARHIQLDSYRRMIGLVLQEVFLFDGTVRDNIAYGRPGATLSDVVEAARNANAHEFISRLPHGYETSLGERGLRLSGGQRQRLAIARAFLLDPQILILDEATSSLDVENERLIQEAMKNLVTRRTTLLIAHRLSTLAQADQIVVLENGRIVHEGTHDQLVRARVPYLPTVQGPSIGEESMAVPTAAQHYGA